MLRERSLGRIIAVASLFALALVASAQRGRQLPSLEAIMAPADRVFTGTVVETGADAWTIRVDENLKGAGLATVKLTFRTASPSDFKGEPLQPGRSYLWATGPADPDRWGPLARPAGFRLGDSLPTFWLLVDLDHLTSRDENDVGRYTVPIFAEDLTVVRSREAALKRARAFAHAHPEPIPVVEAPIPNAFVTQSGIDPNAFAFVVFPKDAAAERAAFRLIDRAEELVGPSRAESDPARRPAREDERTREVTYTRETGIRLLADFKSKANVARLRRLLTDPSLVRDPYSGSDSAPWVYSLRRAAYDVLKGWGVAVPEPVLKAPAPKPSRTFTS